MIYGIIGRSLAMVDDLQRPRVIILVVFLLVQACLDVFSVVSIVPLALLVIRPAALLQSPLLQALYHTAGFQDVRSFSLALIITLIAFLLLKHYLTRLIGNYKINLVFSISGTLTKQVTHNFSHVSYPAYYDLKSSQELNRVINLPTMFAHNILLPLATVLTEGCVLLLLVGLLLFYNAGSIVVLAVVLIPPALFYHMNRRGIKSINEVIRGTYPQVIEKFMALYESLVEIKLYQKEGDFSKSVDDANHEVLKAQSKRNKLFLHSARLVETTAALGLCVLAGYFILAGSSIETSVVWIGLFGAAAVRAIPSFNRIFAAYLEIKTNVFVLEELKKFRFKMESSAGERVEFKNEVKLQGIRFGYPGKTLLFEDISLLIRRGEKIALTGKSGTGKTTLLMLMMQFLRQETGEVWIDNQKLSEGNIGSWRKHIAYVPQSPVIADASILDNIMFGKNAGDANMLKINLLIEHLGLASWVKSLPEGLMTRLGEKGIKISGGQRQRLAIARALYSGRPVLLLDEITNQLDDQTEKEVWAYLKTLSAGGITIMMITHHHDLFQEFDSVYELKDHLLVRRDPL